MLGLKKENDKYIFTVACSKEKLYLNLYSGNRKVKQIAFDPALRIGDVWRLEVSEDLGEYSYCYETDHHIFTDPDGTVFEGRKKFGNLKDGTRILKTPIQEAVAIPEESEEWMNDRPLGIPYEDSILYRLHVRGFTKHHSSHVPKDERGTFRGIIDKIPYLKELGINGIELMPPYEFNEVMLPDFGSENPYQTEIKPTGKINYWGFTKDAMQLAPKSAYTSDHKNPRNEFRTMVLALHKAGIEVIVDLYFTSETLPDQISQVMRYWRIHYHVDGIHMIGNAPFSVIARDPYLSRFKIFADHWEDGNEMPHHGPAAGLKPRYLADYNNGFQDDMRRVLKGDEDMLRTLMYRIEEHPTDRATIHYMANVGGFSLMDALSYDRKHNELNHEDNRDGTDQNHSWNCGEEGKSRKKSVKLLRKKMWRNAYVLLMLSQGTPLIQAGDEFAATRLGNNNAYCQDNEINWLDWSLISKNEDFYNFAKYMIDFRRRHAVFRQKEPLRNLDYRSVGIPDASFHGVNAWKTDFENFRRQLGVMYAGAYAGDDSFLVLYNFHWEKHSFLLAHPPVGMVWAISIDTANEAVNGIIQEGSEVALLHNALVVEPRSIVVLKAIKDIHYRAKKKKTPTARKTKRA